MSDLNKLTIPTDVEWIDSDSSLIKRYGYSPEREAIVIDFKTNGSVWQYAGPEALSLFQQMLTAPSVGKFFHVQIRDNAELKATEYRKEEL